MNKILKDTLSSQSKNVSKHVKMFVLSFSYVFWQRYIKLKKIFSHYNRIKYLKLCINTIKGLFI